MSFTLGTDKKNILDKNIQLLGDFNVNHPLPYLWNFSVRE